MTEREKIARMLYDFEQGVGGEWAFCVGCNIHRVCRDGLCETCSAKGAEEYMTVTISRDGKVTAHNAFDANFDEMVEATRKIIAALQERLDNRLKCPFASGEALREGDDKRHPAEKSCAVIASLQPRASLRDDIIRAMEKIDREDDPASLEQLADAALATLSREALFGKGKWS